MYPTLSFLCTCCVSQKARPLLADAEVAEDLVQQVFAHGFARDLSEGVEGAVQVYRDERRRHACFYRDHGGCYVLLRAAQRVEVAQTRDSSSVAALDAFASQHERSQTLLQGPCAACGGC